MERTNLEGHQIGKIEIHDTYTTVEVPQDSRDEAIQSLNGCKINGRKVAVRLYEDRGPAVPTAIGAGSPEKSGMTACPANLAGTEA